MKIRDQLETQSLMLMLAALVGHLGNYAYHVITGRMLSDTEYGLLMALFGIINLLLIPMSALGLALTREVAGEARGQSAGRLSALFRKWLLGMGLAAAGLMLLAYGFAGPLQRAFGFNRLAPVLLAAFIPGFNLLLTLSGSFLQGLQSFRGLALRGSLMFALKASLVGLCLWLGWRAAGWALLAHVLGMAGALALSLVYLLPVLRQPADASAPPAGPVLRRAMEAVPVLLAFSVLMTADVILARRFFAPELSGRFAQAATLGRMILWLPLPIAQVMFPKVVREGSASAAQVHTLRKAMVYTLLLVGLACAAAWLFASPALRVVYGITRPEADQIRWLRGTAGAMALLGPVWLLLQYELARGRIRRLLPLCLIAPAFPLASYLLHPDPAQLLLLLTGLNAAALLSCLPVLRRENPAASSKGN